ncbi:MAG TPA: WecB/TagA/CpsF family glycosyltransferase [Cyclobacteriaceae bacterium]|nr:WecB/TagA/CpsF family glycosyltransferase [Cyclobacteriaceae bacterium]
MTKSEVEVLGVPLFASNIESATALVIEACQSTNKNNYCISATGAHGLVFAKKNKVFEDTLKSFFINLPDGMPGVWVGKMKGSKGMKRCYGPDFFLHMMTSTKNLAITHFFCGGNEGIANQLKEAVAQKFANTNVVGTFCPPFKDIRDYDYKGIADQINQTKANIVWIGLSTPKQELFAKNLSQFTKVDFIITVGAAFDFHTDRVTQAPRLLQKAGLEWFFRFLMEPKRLYKRYLEIVPMFIYYNLKELFTFATRK